MLRPYRALHFGLTDRFFTFIRFCDYVFISTIYGHNKTITSINIVHQIQRYVFSVTKPIRPEKSFFGGAVLVSQCNGQPLQSVIH
jgi:hypothetical protein